MGLSTNVDYVIDIHNCKGKKHIIKWHMPTNNLMFLSFKIC